jgi:hypothetical protein
MTKRDWLDDVLRSRPVDDEGFSARVTGLGRGEARTWWTVRVVIAVVVIGGIAACMGAEWAILGLMLGPDDRGVEGRVWLADHRADFARAVAEFDTLPLLRRRTGRDASAVLNEAIRKSSYPNVKPEDSFACESEAGEVQANRVGRPVTGVCDTSWITGLAAYDEWKTPPDDAWLELDTLRKIARVHLRRAAAAALVAGAPAPFAVAARDVEALGRLALTNSGRGAQFFRVVAEEHDRAARDGRTGDHVIVVDAAAADRLAHIWVAGSAFISAAATDDDVAAIGRMQSVLACGALGDTYGQYGPDAIDTHYLDAHRVDRVRALDRTGCSIHPATSAEKFFCSPAAPPRLCRLLLVPTSLPPFRQRVVRRLERIELRDLVLVNAPSTAPATTAPATTAPATTSEQP